jgi:spermidine/putrescine transport system substrate-binding protein
MPYMWGTIGIGYRISRVDGVPDSWKWVFDSDKYSGRIALLSESSTMLGVAMKYLGYSLNETDPARLKEAEELLIKQKPHIKVIAEDNGQDLLLSGEVDLAVEWNGDILQIMAEDDDVSYVVPTEGGLVWQDTLCIPNGAPHPDNAHKFINFILDADAGADIADFIQYATPNKAARAKLGPEYSQNPAIFPPDETLARCESAIYLGEKVTRQRDEAWTRFLSA